MMLARSDDQLEIPMLSEMLFKELVHQTPATPIRIRRPTKIREKSTQFENEFAEYGRGDGRDPEHLVCDTPQPW